MLDCMDKDNLQVHFQYGKRNALTGATACFDQKEYVKSDSSPKVEDMIPYTNLNICHKNDDTQQRCFMFGYQVNIYVEDVTPLLEPRPYVKIEYTGMRDRMLILPGDRVSVNFGSDFPEKCDNLLCREKSYEAFRMVPDIYSNALPEHMKKRYRTKNGEVRLPCNDVMIADSMSCSDVVIYCTKATDLVQF